MTATRSPEVVEAPLAGADDLEHAASRREFLRKCGKYAVVVPPTMAFLLARPHDAKANNTGSSGHIHHGNHGNHDS